MLTKNAGTGAWSVLLIHPMKSSLKNWFHFKNEKLLYCWLQTLLAHWAVLQVYVLIFGSTYLINDHLNNLARAYMNHLLDMGQTECNLSSFSDRSH